MIDGMEILRRAVKYLIEGSVIALVAFFLPKKTLNVEEIVIIALVASSTLAILDIFIPSMYDSTKNGAGIGIGLQLVKFGLA